MGGRVVRRGGVGRSRGRCGSSRPGHGSRASSARRHDGPQAAVSLARLRNGSAGPPLSTEVATYLRATEAPEPRRPRLLPSNLPRERALISTPAEGRGETNADPELRNSRLPGADRAESTGREMITGPTSVLSADLVRSAAGNTPTLSDLAQLLRKLRRRHGRHYPGGPLTYREIAARLGFSHGSIGEYLAGNVLPPVDRLDALTVILGATTTERRLLADLRDDIEDARLRPHTTPRRRRAVSEPRPSSTPAGATMMR